MHGLWDENSIDTLKFRVVNLFQEAPGHIKKNFNVYMNVLEMLLDSGKYKFNHQDMVICFTLKGSTNKFFALTKRGFIRGFCHPINKNSL